jgi:hypothetical protein
MSSTTGLPPTLAKIRAENPGRYLTGAEFAALEAEAPYLRLRIRAARAAEQQEVTVLKVTLESIFRRYDFASGRGGFGQEKCYRDVGLVYRHCVFAMLCDDRSMLENKLLIWMRTIVQSLNFPAETESIAATYTLLRKETLKRLSAEDGALLDPMLRACEEILPAKAV